MTIHSTTDTASPAPASTETVKASAVASHTPWELLPNGYIRPNHKSPVALLKLRSPWIEGAWDDDAEAAANAAFIVRACNSHEALITALELAEDVLSRRPHSTEIWPNGMHPQTGITQIRAALAAARGET